MDLEKYLKECSEKGIIDFTLRVSTDTSDGMAIYIHPSNVSGKTIDFKVNGNDLIFKFISGE